MTSRRQATYLFQNTGPLLTNLSNHFRAESGKAHTLLNNQKSTALFERLRDGPDIQRINLRRTNDFTNNIVLFEQNDGCAFDIWKHADVADDGGVVRSVRAKSNCRKSLVAAFEHELLWNRFAKSDSVKKFILDDDRRAIDRREQFVVYQSGIVSRVQRQHHRARNAHEMF